MPRQVVCKLDELEIGKITPAKIGALSIILSKLPSGEIRAVSARCPHQGANLQYGCISGRTESRVLNQIQFRDFGETLRCPWHGFEFSLLDGRPIVETGGQVSMKLRIYPSEVEGNDVVVTI
jgi:nitrite reductase (NADH) small subunit